MKDMLPQSGQNLTIQLYQNILTENKGQNCCYLLFLIKIYQTFQLYYAFSNSKTLN